jgi:hypothetical protein
MQALIQTVDARKNSFKTLTEIGKKALTDITKN